MSTLAKTFVVINLVLVTAFFTMSLSQYQHTTDWRDQFEKLAERYKASVRFYEADRKNLEAESAAKDAYIQVSDEEKRNLRSHIDGLADQLLAKTAENNQNLQVIDRLLDDHGKVVAQLQNRQDRIALLERERDLAREERGQAVQDKEQAETQVARMLSIKNSLERDLSELRKEYVTVRQDLSDKELVLTQLEAKGIVVADLVAAAPARPTPAQVLAVMDDIQPALVLLSAGANEGVKTGDEFTIYRGSEFVARVVVEKVLPNRCGARVKFPLDAHIRAGDSANTILQ